MALVAHWKLDALIKTVYLVFSLSLLLTPLQAVAVSQQDLDAILHRSEIYDPNSTCSDSTVGGSISRFLQALALQESGEDPTQGGSAGGARGKYQYIDSTWISSATTYYPPALKYPTANLAPESVQDAVAYIEYGVKFKQLDNDLFKLAVSHFYPAANDNPSLLDVIPPSNVITPRQYANAVIDKYKANAGAKIPIKPQDAPDFSTYAQKAGVSIDTASSNSTDALSSSCDTSVGAVSGDIVQTALNFAWDTSTGHSSLDSAKQSYKDAWTKYDQASDMTDCGAFVATVMVASGVDPNYPKYGTNTQSSYVQSHPEKYEVFSKPTDTSTLRPGDILIYDNGGAGHTMIFVGPQPKGYSAVDASWGDHTPQAQPNVAWMFSEPNVIVVRVKN